MTQEQAMEILLSWQNCFLTGKAWTWKSYLTDKFIQDRRDYWKNVVVVAPTGIAAINIGWATIHSTFKMHGTYLLKRAVKNQSVDWMRIHTIIIDEISMVWPDYVDYIDYLLQEERWCDRPFGWIQMIFVGDAKQLPPVYVGRTDQEKHEIDKLIQKYGELTFDKAVAYKWFTQIELDEIKRTSDPKLIEILNEVREGMITSVSKLNQGYGDAETVHLMPFNNLVDKYNSQKFQYISWEARTYDAIIKFQKLDDFKEKDYVSPVKLELKVWSRVMVTKNLECGLVNGDLWTVKKLHQDYVLIHSDRFNQDYWIEITEWKRIEYHGMNERVIWTFSQIPLKLAWAMTIHKSQGLTLDNVCVTVVKWMSKELLYVGLSRCTNYEKLFIHHTK